MKSSSGRALLWLSAGLVLMGSIIGSSAGGVASLVLAALCAVAPVVAGPAGRRIAGAALLLAAVGLGIVRLPAAREEMGRYRAHVMKGHP